MSWQEVEQLTVAGLINGSFYALLGVSFGLVLGVTGRFPYAYGLVFTLAAYAASVLETPAGEPAPATFLGVGIERLVYRPLAAASGVLSLLTIFIAALGLTIAGTNII